MTREQDSRDSRAEVFEAIGHPTRIRILQVLHDKPMGFADLKRAVGVESSGNLAFHLAKLQDLVRTAQDGNYVLTDDGREALWSVGNITGTREVPGAGLHVRRTGKNRQRVVIAGVVLTLILLGSVAAYQQTQLATQQSQISSQQAQIGLYVNEAHPFANGQSASLVLGQKDFTSYRPTTSQVGIDDPIQTLFDSLGNLWVVDTGNNRILEFSPPFSTGASATLVLGQKNYTGSAAATTIDGLGNYPGSPLQLSGHQGSISNGPGGAAFDSVGDLWVVDVGNNRIVEFKPPFATGMPASLVIGQSNFSSASFGTSRSMLKVPSRIAFDSFDNLWLLDSGNNRVLEFKPPFSNGMDASLVIGQPRFDDGLAATSQSGLHSITYSSDLAVDFSDNLWVGDLGNNRILEFEPPFHNGMNATLVIGQPNFVMRNGFDGNDPATAFGYALAFDPNGNLWATHNQRLLEYKPPFSTGMSASIEIGQPDLVTVAWVGGQNGLDYPAHPSFDRSGNLWVPDGTNNRVLEFTSGFPISNGATPSQGYQAVWQVLYFVAVPAVLVVGVVLLVVILRRRGRFRKQTESES